jgi:S1-C subfamily serine protease
LTAFHVVSDARFIRVVCPGASEKDAHVLRGSPALDLALVRVAGRLPGHLTLASTRSLQVGDQIFTVGFPVPDLLGRDSKFTDGVVSALTAVGRESALFQMTVPVQPGNSGGPVINSDGEVVGVVVSTAAVEAFLAGTGTLPQNVNWAVKADYAIPLFEPPAAESKARTRRESIERALRATCMIEAER